MVEIFRYALTLTRHRKIGFIVNTIIWTWYSTNAIYLKRSKTNMMLFLIRSYLCKCRFKKKLNSDKNVQAGSFNKKNLENPFSGKRSGIVNVNLLVLLNIQMQENCDLRHTINKLVNNRKKSIHKSGLDTNNLLIKNYRTY